MKKVLAVALMCFVSAAGCGGGGGYSGPTGSLSGKVTIDGAVPPDGTVMVLLHKETGFGASAKIKSDGSYGLVNVRSGEYRVGLINNKAVEAENIDPDAAMTAIEDGSYEEPPSPLPEELGSPETSGVTLNVPEGEGQFDLQI